MLRLGEGEIRGQWWEDNDGDVLNIRRSVWRTHLNDETKTHEDEGDSGVVPIIEPLRVLLDAVEPDVANGLIFPKTIGGAFDFGQSRRPLIKPVLGQTDSNGRDSKLIVVVWRRISSGSVFRTPRSKGSSSHGCWNRTAVLNAVLNKERPRRC